MSAASETATGELRRLLAAVLRWGTLIATVLIAAGLLATLVRTSGRGSGAALEVVNAGIAVFILLPVLRVVLMLVAFARERDYRFSFAAGLVLGIILFGFALNIALPPPT